MKIIIVGGGKLTYFLSKQFTNKGYKISIVVDDEKEAISLSRKLKQTVIVGSESNPQRLKEAGAYQADVILALTPYDQENLIACQIAQRHFGVPRTIALVNDPDNQKVFEQLGITIAFSSTQILASLIEQQADLDAIKNLIPVAQGQVNVTEIALEENLEILGKKLREIELPEDTLIACILRKGEVIVPRGSTILKARDRLILISQPENSRKLVKFLTGKED